MKKKIRRVRPLTIVLICFTVLCFGAFGCYYVYESRKVSPNPPKITFDSGYSNTYSVKASEEDYLKGVTAYDSEDGDVTNSIIIESISPFASSKNHTRVIKYVAFDKDNHVVKASKEISYNDYTSPVIKPVKSLIIGERKVAEILACFTATDCIDGDISNKIVLESIDSDVNTKKFPIELSVTNSCGETVTLKSEITIDESK